MSEIIRTASVLAELDVLAGLAVDVKKVARASEGSRYHSGLVACTGQQLEDFASEVQSEATRRKRIVEGYLSTLEPQSLQEASVLLFIANARLSVEACDSSDDDRSDVNRCLRSAISYLISNEPAAKDLLPGYCTADLGIKSWDLMKSEMCCEAVRYTSAGDKEDEEAPSTTITS